MAKKNEVVPKHIEEKWVTFRSQLTEIEKITKPRWINYYKEIREFQLHGFCDTSERAYGAVIYTHVKTASGNIKITILKAKSNVAPIKRKSTLPRLELYGATLLAKMLKNVQTSLNIPNTNVSINQSSKLDTFCQKQNNGNSTTNQCR